NRIAPLKAGDGIVFDSADWRSPEEPEEGGRVYQALPGLDGSVQLRFANNAVRFERIRPGDLVWRTHGPELHPAALKYREPSTPVDRQGLTVHVEAREGRPLVTKWQVVKRPDFSIPVVSPDPLVAAQNRGCSIESVRDQLGRLGNTPYELAEVTLETEGQPFVPASLLNQVRR